jgi:hypothetical protein
MNYKYIWVFCGEGSRFPSAIFTSYEIGHAWIEKNKLTGTLTQYPLDKDVYTWAIENNFFTPKKSHEKDKKFIQGFSCAMQKHYHYEDGIID